MSSLVLPPPASQPPWRLRPARPTDRLALQRGCMPETEPKAIDWLLNHCQRSHHKQRGLGLVAALPDGRLVGFGQLIRWSRSAEISDLIVGEAWRGQGIGSAIITRLVQAAHEMPVDKVEIGVALRNERALRLYQRLGFTPGRTRTLNLGSGLEPVMYLWMALTPAAEDYPASPSMAMRSPSSVTYCLSRSTVRQA